MRLCRRKQFSLCVYVVGSKISLWIYVAGNQFHYAFMQNIVLPAVVKTLKMTSWLLRSSWHIGQKCGSVQAAHWSWQMAAPSCCFQEALTVISWKDAGKTTRLTLFALCHRDWQQHRQSSKSRLHGLSQGTRIFKSTDKLIVLLYSWSCFNIRFQRYLYFHILQHHMPSPPSAIHLWAMASALMRMLRRTTRCVSPNIARTSSYFVFDVDRSAQEATAKVLRRAGVIAWKFRTTLSTTQDCITSASVNRLLSCPSTTWSSSPRTTFTSSVRRLLKSLKSSQDWQDSDTLSFRTCLQG